MMDFVAIDFEVANNEPSSICSVGIVVVREGRVQQRVHRLVRPVPNYYMYHNTRVHGMTRRDTDFQVGFPLVWRELQPLFAGLPFVAHNASFEQRCLKAVHEAYNMPYPNYTFHCTCSISRKVFGSDLPNHRLPTVAAACGYYLSAHHNALADAEACAAIALKIL
jgi:DNA polymerase-3 subunit epsilon